MKRISFMVLAIILLLTATGYCAANINPWGNTDLNPLLHRLLPYDLLTLGSGQGGVSTMVTGTTEIPLGYSVVKAVCSTKTTTLGAGTPQQVLTIVAVDRTGTMAITPATGVKFTGWASASMDADGETLTLMYVNDTVGWIVLGYSGTTITGANSGS